MVQEGKIINLKTYLYPYRGELKGIMFLFHGLSSHMNHGAHIAEAHTHLGVAVVGMDLRGIKLKITINRFRQIRRGKRFR